VVDCFILVTPNLDEADKLKTILSSRYDLILVELSSADNFTLNLIDNIVCTNWSFGDKNQIKIGRLGIYLDDAIIQADTLCASTRSSQWQLEYEQEYALMCQYWMTFFDQQKQYADTQKFDKFLSLPELGGDSLSKLISESYCTMYLGQNLQQTFDASGGINSRLSDNSSIDAKLWYQNVIFNKNNATGCWPGMNTTTGLYAPTNASYNTKCGTSLSTNVGPSGSAPIYQYVSQTDYQPYSEIGSSLVYTNRYDQGTSTVGIDSRRISATDSQLNYGSPTVTNGQVTVTPGTNTYIYSKATQQFWGVFYEQKYRPIDALEATLGLRIDSWTNSNGSISINNSFNVQPDQTQYSFDPSLSFKYYATDIWSLRSSIYKGFRAPGLNNMYRSYGSTATGSTNASISNPNLSPETLYGWEIGTDYKSSAVDISFTYYNLFVENMNYSMALSNTSTGIAALYYRTIKSSYGISATSFNYYSDLFDSRSTGIELGTKWYVAPNLKIIANFIYTNTYLTSTIDPLKNPSFTQLGGVSPNVGILGLDWQITPKLSTYWQVRAVSQAFLDTAQTTMMPGYATVDFNVMYHIDNKTTLTTNVINLFNQGYYTDGGSSSTTPTLGMPILVMVGAKHLF
jgi:iron complex outermembrane receptor protein